MLEFKNVGPRTISILVIILAVQLLGSQCVLDVAAPSVQFLVSPPKNKLVATGVVVSVEAIAKSEGNYPIRYVWTQIAGPTIVPLISSDGTQFSIVPRLSDQKDCEKTVEYKFTVTASDTAASAQADFTIGAINRWCYFKRFSSPLLSDMVNKLALASDDTLWIATSSGLNSYSASNWASFPLTSNKVTQIGIDSQQKVWLGGDNGLQWFKDPYQNWNTVSSSDLFGQKILSLGFDENRIYVGNVAPSGAPTSKGISIFDLDGKIRDSIRAYAIAGNLTQAINIDAKGRRWFGADLFGVWIYPADGSSNFLTLPSSITTLALKHDRLGNQWIGRKASLADNGALRCQVEALLEGKTSLSKDDVSKHCTEFTKEKTGLTSNTIRAFAFDYQDRVFMATPEGITVLTTEDPNSKPIVTTLTKGTTQGALPCEDINDIAFESNGHVLWIATGGCGLIRMLVD